MGTPTDPPHGYTEYHPSARELVKRGQLLGENDRITLGHQTRAGAELQRGGYRGDGSKRD